MSDKKLEVLYQKALSAATPSYGRVKIGDRVFSSVAWILDKITRSNGTVSWQLSEMAGRERTDYPAVQPDGTVAFDHPESLPKAVRQWAQETIKTHS